jgi:hypothetical protein
MSAVFSLLPAFLREISRFTVTPATGGIVLKSGHTGRAFNLEHHDKQQLVNATRMLADAIEAWAKVPAVIVQENPAPAMKEGPYGPIHEAPADILMGSLAEKPATQPDIIHHGLAIEVKAKRSYTRRTKNV